MPREHDFVEAFRNLTDALKQSGDLIKLDETITTPFQHTATPSDTTGLEDFAKIILQKGLFTRLDATAVYTVVFAVLQYPPCPTLSKIAYHMLENLLICRDVTKASSKSQDRSVERLNEIKKRSKIISTVLVKRLRQTLFDVKRHVKIRRLVAEIIATLCVGDRRACSILASDEAASSIGSLFRCSDDPVLRLHVGDIARHLRANDIEMIQIWGHRTDEDAMDFPSSAELTSSEAAKLFTSMERMQDEDIASSSEAHMYRLSEIRVRERHVHSSSNDSALILSDSIIILVAGKEKVFDHYETPINKHVELQSINDSGNALMLHIVWTNNNGFWYIRGKKQAVATIELLFAEQEMRETFKKNFETVKARLARNGIADAQMGHQETQKLSMPVLKFSEDADNTDIEEILISSPQEPRTREALPAKKGNRAAKAKQSMSETIVNQHQPTSAVFKARSEVEKQSDNGSIRSRRASGARSQFMEKVTAENIISKTPRLTKSDEVVANQVPGTSPSKHVARNKFRPRESDKTGSMSNQQVGVDPVFTMSLEQQQDADYQAFQGRATADKAGAAGIQEQNNGEDDDFEGNPEMLFDIHTSRREDELAKPMSVIRTKPKELRQAPPVRDSKTKLNPVNINTTGISPTQAKFDSEETAEKDSSELEARHNAKVDYDEHLRAIDADKASEQPKSASKPKMSKTNAKQRNQRLPVTRAKGEEEGKNTAKRKGGHAKGKLSKKKTTAPSSPKPTRRSQRKATKNISAYAEQDSSEEYDEEGATMHVEEPAIEAKTRSKPKLKTRKAPFTAVRQSQHYVEKKAGTNKQTAIEIDATDDEHVVTVKAHTENISAQAKSLQKSPHTEGVAEHAMTGSQDGDVVEDSYPREDLSGNRAATHLDATNASERVGKSNETLSVRSKKHAWSEEIAMSKGLPIETRSVGSARPPSDAPSATKSTVTNLSKVRRSKHDRGSSRSGEHSRRPSVVHFESDGPVNQGILSATLPTQIAPSHETPKARDTNVRARISTPTRPSLSAPRHVVRADGDVFDNSEAVVPAICESTDVPQRADQESTGILAQDGSLPKEDLEESNSSDEADLEEQHEHDLADVEAASEQSDATSSEIVVNDNRQEQSAEYASHSTGQTQTRSNQSHSHDSQSHHSDSENSEELSADTSSAEEGNESEFEAPLHINENLPAHIARPTRQTHRATDTSKVVVGAVPSLLDKVTGKNDSRQADRVQKVARVGVQVPPEQDMIAITAKELNPGARANIHFKGFRPQATTLNFFNGAHPEPGHRNVENVFDHGSAPTADPRSRINSSFGGSPSRVIKPVTSDMPPPPNTFTKRDIQVQQNFGNIHQQNFSEKTRDNENKSNRQQPDIRRVRPSAVACSTSMVEQHHQSTPLPYTMQLLATASPAYNSVNSENNQRSDTGDTTLVDNSVFIQNDEPRSPSLISSRLSEGSDSPRMNFRDRSRVGVSHHTETLVDMNENFRRNVETSIMGITRQILIRLDTEEHVSKTLVETHRRGCTRTVEELKKNAIIRVQHDAGKTTSSVEHTRSKLQEAFDVVAELQKKQVKTRSRLNQTEIGSVEICKTMLQNMLKRRTQTS